MILICPSTDRKLVGLFSSRYWGGLMGTARSRWKDGPTRELPEMGRGREPLAGATTGASDGKDSRARPMVSQRVVAVLVRRLFAPASTHLALAVSLHLGGLFLRFLGGLLIGFLFGLGQQPAWVIRVGAGAHVVFLKRNLPVIGGTSRCIGNGRRCGDVLPTIHFESSSSAQALMHFWHIGPSERATASTVCGTNP